MKMQCEVGKMLPKYFGTGKELVRAIFEEGSYYMVCTKSRGAESGPPIMAGHEGKATYFKTDQDLVLIR